MCRLTMRIIASSLLFVSCAIPVFANGNGFSLGLFAAPSFQANWNESTYHGYPPAFQSGAVLGGELRYRWEAGPYADLRYYHRSYDASTVTGFHLYRGYEGNSASLGAGWLFPPYRYGNADITGGIRIEGAANFENYSGTELYFFYPEISLVPSVELTKSGDSPVGFGIELPVTLPFRKGVSTLSVGVAFTLSFYPVGIVRAVKEKDRQ
jgi:hypothetical protein